MVVVLNATPALGPCREEEGLGWTPDIAAVRLSLKVYANSSPSTVRPCGNLWNNFDLPKRTNTSMLKKCMAPGTTIAISILMTRKWVIF